MIELSATYKDGTLTLHRKKYIEDGWYIENVGQEWKVFDIPQYGGEPEFIDTYQSFAEALAVSMSLT